MTTRDDDTITTREIAELLGVSGASARRWAVSIPDFPAPCSGLSKRTRRWRRSEIIAWRDKHAAMTQRNPSAELASSDVK